MITCPWCGTTHLSFQPNCSNCGGPLPRPAGNASPSPTSFEEIPPPPPAPRPISDRYVWKLLFSDGRGIVALVLGLLGIIFGFVGGVLTLFVITAFVGIPFLLIGLIFLTVALVLGTRAYEQARQIVNVLRIGEVTQGQILDAQRNYSVAINGRNPWDIRYEFQAAGQNYDGKVSTLNEIGPTLQAGSRVYILYLPNEPQWNSIYPHP